jgi:hypothetical protein
MMMMMIIIIIIIIIITEIYETQYVRNTVAARTSETSVDIQLRRRQYIPEGSELHTRRREHLKSSNISHNPYYVSLSFFTRESIIDIQMRFPFLRAASMKTAFGDIAPRWSSRRFRSAYCIWADLVTLHLLFWHTDVNILNPGRKPSGVIRSYSIFFLLFTYIYWSVWSSALSLPTRFCVNTPLFCFLTMEGTNLEVFVSMEVVSVVILLKMSSVLLSFFNHFILFCLFFPFSNERFIICLISCELKKQL